MANVFVHQSIRKGSTNKNIKYFQILNAALCQYPLRKLRRITRESGSHSSWHWLQLPGKPHKLVAIMAGNGRRQFWGKRVNITRSPVGLVLGDGTGSWDDSSIVIGEQRTISISIAQSLHLIFRMSLKRAADIHTSGLKLWCFLCYQPNEGQQPWPCIWHPCADHQASLMNVVRNLRVNEMEFAHVESLDLQSNSCEYQRLDVSLIGMRTSNAEE